MGHNPVLGEEDSINAWRSATKGSRDAIQRGDFGGISLNDFRALYANHLIEKRIRDNPEFLETVREIRETIGGGWGGSANNEILILEAQMKVSYAINMLSDFFMGQEPVK